MNFKKHTKRVTVSLSLLFAGLITAPAFAAENPMDHVGVQHNMYLGCLQSTSDTSADSLVRLVEKCGFDPEMPLDDFVKTYQPVVELDPTLTVSRKMSVFRDQFSKYEFSFFERIDSVVATADSAATADKMFAELEREAIANLDARTRAGANVLGSLSVARHSTAYWSKFSGSSDAGSSTAGKMRWWKWLLVAAADVAGYAVTENIGTAASASEFAYDHLNSP